MLKILEYRYVFWSCIKPEIQKILYPQIEAHLKIQPGICMPLEVGDKAGIKIKGKREPPWPEIPLGKVASITKRK